LGWIGVTPLLDIWRSAGRGEVAAQLRAGMFPDDCGGCGTEIAVEGRASSYPVEFDYLERLGDDGWPARIEFNLSNVCNLQCVQCNGDLSSSIRIHREGRPPTPSPYDEAFFEELRPFLHHLARAQFAGGEPFLARENYRAWDLIVDERPGLEVNVVTNATQWSPRVESVLERLPMNLTFSLDGVTPDIYDAVRVGGNVEAVLANVERYRRAVAPANRWATINFCLMVGTHRGFADLLRYAEDRDMDVKVQFVRDPPSSSLLSLDPEALIDVLRELEAQQAALLPVLVRNRRAWLAELDRLRAWVELPPETRRATLSAGRERVLEFPVRRRATSAANPVPTPVPGPRLAPTGLPAASPVDAWFEVNADDEIVGADPLLGELVGVAPDELIGMPVARLQALFERRHGAPRQRAVDFGDDDAFVGSAVHRDLGVHYSMRAFRDDQGVATGGRVDIRIDR